jgi:hypothetical protein
MSKAKQSKAAKKARRVAKAVRKVQRKFTREPIRLTKKEVKRLKKHIVIKRNKPSDEGVTLQDLRIGAEGYTYTQDQNKPYPKNAYQWAILTGRRPPIRFRVTNRHSPHFRGVYHLDPAFPIEEVLNGRVCFVPLHVAGETLYFGTGAVEECS